ncbi:MAG: hypothetical protein WD377_09680 [Nitriliruptoraceae bacterium]
MGNMSRSRRRLRRIALISVLSVTVIGFAGAHAVADEHDAVADLPPSTLPALLAATATSDSGDTDADADDADTQVELPAELLATATENADEEALVWLTVAAERGALAFETAQAQRDAAFAEAMARYDEAMQRLEAALARRDAALEARDGQLEEALARRDAALTRRDEQLAAVRDSVGPPSELTRPDQNRAGPESGTEDGAVPPNIGGTADVPDTTVPRPNVAPDRDGRPAGSPAADSGNPGR